jgi:ribose-phosphate pyrophosphokinase
VDFGGMIKLRIKEKEDSPWADQEITCFTFPGGEEHVNYNTYKTIIAAEVKAVIQGSSDFMRLCLLSGILDSFGCEKILKIHYFPYARQDRVCARGDSFSLKVVCDIINSLGFHGVEILDPHSDVLPALLENCRVKTQLDVIASSKELRLLALNTTAVSPDAGANKKTHEIMAYSPRQFIRADKIRNLETGEIKETVVYCESLSGKRVTIWDDICDGGRTFIELAKILKSKGAEEVNLYVTHGIFSKGVQVLLDSGIDNIYTTSSFEPRAHKNLNIIEI